MPASGASARRSKDSEGEAPGSAWWRRLMRAASRTGRAGAWRGAGSNLSRPALLAVLGEDRSRDAAPHGEPRFQPHPARPRGLHEVVEDPVGDGFMEGTLVTEGPDVELEGLQLHAKAIGDVVQHQRGEVRLA